MTEPQGKPAAGTTGEEERGLADAATLGRAVVAQASFIAALMFYWARSTPAPITPTTTSR